MNIPNYKASPFRGGVDFLLELELLHPDGAGKRLVSRRWVMAALSPAYGTYRMLEHQHMLAACMEARADAAMAKLNREEEEEAARLTCSFCGKDENEVAHMIKGPEATHDCWVSIQTAADSTGECLGTVSVIVNICDECVALCAQVLADHKSGAAQ